MKAVSLRRRLGPFFAVWPLLMATVATPAFAAPAEYSQAPQSYGPYNGAFLQGGDGLSKPLLTNDPLTKASTPWTIYCWVSLPEPLSGPVPTVGLGQLTDEYSRYLVLNARQLELWAGPGNSLAGPAQFSPATWHMIAAVFDGLQFTLYSDGAQVAQGTLLLGSVEPVVELAPATGLLPAWSHFGGKIAGFTVLREALNSEAVKQLSARPLDFSLIEFEAGSKSWPVQARGQIGYRAPQDPATMPHSKAPFSAPVAHKAEDSPALVSSGNEEWTLAGQWMLAAAPGVKENGASISQNHLDTSKWMRATVPGTVLTTMIDRGIYPDPDYGLNNLAIPESLNKQDYWYRTQFPTPDKTSGRRITLTFEGINYQAEVWLNGHLLGNIKGAFTRGIFDVTGALTTKEKNTLAVRISPPPHPGIPQEQSVKGGPGENGGIMCLDGPTFVATEGWDWIPGVRDRDSGIWQPVKLKVSGDVGIGDVQVITRLPLPDTNHAQVFIEVPLKNSSNVPVRGELAVSFEQMDLRKQITVPPGNSSVSLTPGEFSQLALEHPRLWWPNGYGSPELYHMTLQFSAAGKTESTKRVRFGVREITYELSLFDRSGHLRRVDYSPTDEHLDHQHVIDVSHEGLRELPPLGPQPPDEHYHWRPYAASLLSVPEHTLSIKESDDSQTAPFLVIKVNGVKIACRGGSWGMDDSRKRVSREKLEPYFRLHRDANINMIRNWVGQNTEQTFFDLADEYGLLVWNDFWESTQNYNIEAQDPQLFLDNARDTILRYRNHPSIALWCGRNEGVPQPILNDGLANLIATLDGTRYYSPDSNTVELQNSGPYRYQDPKLYFTTLNRGFSVETGTPSMPTLEAVQAWFPQPDRWPIDDVWAYHDWHQSGNGDVAPFMNEVEREFGAATGLDDFERKAQMLNYVDHRAIFEGMNAHLWSPNSGRLLWMTQPAWPSTNWQILSSDYDTQASYYGVKKACEPVHIQLDLSTYDLQVINTTVHPYKALTLNAEVFSVDNHLLLQRSSSMDAPTDSQVEGPKLDLAPLMSGSVVFVRLELKDSDGKLLSRNLYWLASDAASYRKLVALPTAHITASVTAAHSAKTGQLHVSLKNDGPVAALQCKITLLDSVTGSRILPTYYSDNYISLLPAEGQVIDIEYPLGKNPPKLMIRGWNLGKQEIQLTP